MTFFPLDIFKYINCFCLLICVFVLLLGCVFVLLVLLVRAKYFCKKNKEFKTALITSFIFIYITTLIKTLDRFAHSSSSWNSFQSTATVVFHNSNHLEETFNGSVTSHVVNEITIKRTFIGLLLQVNSEHWKINETKRISSYV